MLTFVIEKAYILHNFQIHVGQIVLYQKGKSRHYWPLAKIINFRERHGDLPRTVEIEYFSHKNPYDKDTKIRHTAWVPLQHIVQLEFDVEHIDAQ